MAKDSSRKGAVKSWGYVTDFLTTWYWQRAAQIGAAQNQTRLTRLK